MFIFKNGRELHLGITLLLRSAGDGEGSRDPVPSTDSFRACKSGRFGFYILPFFFGQGISKKGKLPPLKWNCSAKSECGVDSGTSECLVIPTVVIGDSDKLMDSQIETSSWWSTTRRILLSPRAFFAQLQEPFNFRKSLVYLTKTALIVAAINTLILTTIFFVVFSSFASILSAFTVIAGVLMTPLIAVAANISPDKVPAAIESIARNGELQVAMISARVGAFIFLGYFATIMMSTCIQSVIAHGFARLLGCAGGFRATAAVYSFAGAAWLLSVIPIVNLFTPVYGAVLNAFGIRHVHQLSSARASFAIALSIAVPVIGCILFSSI